MKLNLVKYLLLAILPFMVSCQKDKSTFSEVIIGKWEWVKTVSPWTGLVDGPVSSYIRKLSD